MEIHAKISLTPIFSFSDFQLRFYCVGLLHLCRNFKHRNWWRHMVLYKIFNTNLEYSGSSFTYILSEKIEILW